MDTVVDPDLYIEQFAQTDDTDELLSVFEKTLARFGFELEECHLVAAANGLIPESNKTTQLARDSAGLSVSSSYNRDQINRLVHLASTQSSAFMFSMNQDRSVSLLSSGGPIEGVCIPMRGKHGSFAIALAKNNNNAEMSSHAVECIDAVGTAFYKKYCSGTESSKTEVKLTRKELDVLELVSRGGTKISIAETMGVTNHAIDFHYRNIMRKYNTSRIVVAVVKAVKGGVI